MTVQTDQTAEVLVSMFTENTGRHMLDSGGAYGRNWERNQGLTVEDFETRDIVTVHLYDDSIDYFSVDAYQFLRRCLEFDEEMDTRFREFAELAPEDPWMKVCDNFMDYLADGGENIAGPYFSDKPMWVNTYNGEDALSQTLQYLMFTVDDEEYVLLQVHGGADVRGGYSAPRVFRHDDNEGVCIYDNARITAHTRYVEPDEPRLFEVPPVDDLWWTSDNAGYSFYGDSGQEDAEWVVKDGKVFYEPWGTEVRFYAP